MSSITINSTGNLTLNASTQIALNKPVSLGYTPTSIASGHIGYFIPTVDVNQLNSGGYVYAPLAAGSVIKSVGSVSLPKGVYLLYGRGHFVYQTNSVFAFTWSTQMNTADLNYYVEKRTYSVFMNVNMSLMVVVNVPATTTYYFAASSSVANNLDYIRYTATRIA
jgi:hypothetical protein